MFGKHIVLGAAMTLLAGMTANATEYQIDPAHSEIAFKVKHLTISTVTGTFSDITGSFDVDVKNLAATKGSAVIKVASISTNNEKRDNHLKSDDFFNAEKFPEIKFVSKSVRNVNMADTTCDLVGDLTIRDVTKEIVLKVKGTGILANDGWGNQRAAFSATGRINRFDFNLKWSKALETGGLVVAQDVDIVLSFEGVHAPDAPKSKVLLFFPRAGPRLLGPALFLKRTPRDFPHLSSPDAAAGTPAPHRSGVGAVRPHRRFHDHHAPRSAPDAGLRGFDGTFRGAGLGLYLQRGFVRIHRCAPAGSFHA